MKKKVIPRVSSKAKVSQIYDDFNILHFTVKTLLNNRPKNSEYWSGGLEVVLSQMTDMKEKLNKIIKGR